ncbi:OmpA family protein [Paludibacter jiangxiensis]|uniref:WD40-like beta propeller repeat-containing protein n=1 Tax=Paludibacter jiangxiensis TaxID=681398 RepID=A0A170YX60_9BACT|nr:OmpA family protein [Paludibacter jiangxiensis]GAT62150.1 WD40-like beta propeller repeat-containing protein [Paludibacter jiangxiensis]
MQHIIEKRSKTVLILCFLLGVFYMNGQTSGQLQKADLAYRGLKFSMAAEYYEAYLSQGTTANPEVLQRLADSYWQMRNYPEALRVYTRLYPNGKMNSTAQEQFRIGELYARQGDYTNATKWLSGLAGYANKVKAYRKAELSVMKGDSMLWNVSYLTMNSVYREFCPYLYAQNLLFSSNRPMSTKTKAFGWDGNYYSRLWQVPVSQLLAQGTAPSPEQVAKAKQLKESHLQDKRLAGVFAGSDADASPRTRSAYLKTEYVKADSSFSGTLISGLDKLNYNSGGISIDGEGTVYFSANYNKPDKHGVNRIRLMEGHYNGNAITNVKALPFGDPQNYSVMHPAINKEGTILIFSSDKKGYPGKYDLYFSRRSNRNQYWAEPFVIPGQVNTAGNEVFPYISGDGYLYYSSDGKEGLGGLDIYRIKLEDAIAGVGTPEHLPSPVNSTSDDFGWTQSTDGKVGYFTSDRVSSEDNIYSARYDEEAVRLAVLAKQPRSVEGLVLDRQTMDLLKNATVFLLNKCDNRVYVAKTDEEGRYSYPVTKTCEVVILGTGKGYSRDCLAMNVTLDKTSKELVQKAPHDLLLDRFPQDFKWKLSDIHYDFDKWNIRADARPILDSLVAILKTYPIKVELGSHTDSRGTFAYNDALSQRRAESAVAYIVSKDIDPSRITAKGYGEHQLLNKCADGVPCSKEEHQANRRTEVKVLIGQPADMPTDFDPSEYRNGTVIDTNKLPADFFGKCK